MVPPARTPLRPDRLRALNLPVAVMVVSDAWGLPTEVVESDGDSADGRTGGRADGHDGGTDPGPTAAQRPAGPPGWSGRAEEDRRVAGSGEAGPPGGGAGRRVEEVVEVWVVEDEWWRNPIHRRYVEVVLEGGAHVMLFEDLTTGEWFIQKP